MIDNQLATVSDVVQLFRERLGKAYPKREVDSLMQLAFEEVMNFRKVDVLLKTNVPVGIPQKALFEAIVEGLERHEPIQYLLGSTTFFGIPLRVNSHVLIPRPETEELVQWVLKNHQSDQHLKVMDLGTGSGCIAIALKSQLPGSMVYGIDVSVEALNLAAQNASISQQQVEFFHFDLLKQGSLGFMKFDIMVSNPPYVTEDDKFEMEPNVLNHEPHLALFAPEDDPLLFYRRIVDLSDGHLKEGGSLYFEINRSYGPEICQLLRDRNYREVELRSDFNGNDRMIRAIKV